MFVHVLKHNYCYKGVFAHFTSNKMTQDEDDWYLIPYKIINKMLEADRAKALNINSLKTAKIGRGRFINYRGVMQCNID